MDSSDDDSKKPWVLVVEDDTELCTQLVRALASSGFRCVSAGKATRAIQLCANQAFACIVLDMKLEQGSGEQVLSVIRKDLRGLNLHTPVLVSSGFLTPDLVKRIGKDIQGAMVKPFKKAEFVEKVHAMCNLPVMSATNGEPDESDGTKS